MLKWYLARFRRMSLPEIFFRIREVLQWRFEWLFLRGKRFNRLVWTTMANPLGQQAHKDKLLPLVWYIFGKKFSYMKGEVDWHRDVFSGKKFPLGFARSINIRSITDLSAKNVWEVNRLQFLVYIVLNYKQTHNNIFLERFVYLMQTWKQQNPYLMGVNWYSNIEVNIRLIVWYYSWLLLDAEQLMRDDPGFSEFVEKTWIPLIYQHCLYSYRHPSRFSSSNNHLIAEYTGLFVATSLWRFKTSKKWNKYARRGLEREIIRQHSANGINKEEAAEYIQFITDFFLIAWAVGMNTGKPFSDKYREMLKKIIYYIYYFLDCKGNYPKYGDEDDGMVILFDAQEGFNNFLSILTSGALIFRDATLKGAGNGMDNKNGILFAAGTVYDFAEIEEWVFERQSIFFPEEGHFIFRKKTNQHEIYFHYDVAPLGFLSIAAHGHADALSFILHVDGQPVFVDPGTYTYHADPLWRDYFTGTLAHNTVRINRKDQATHEGPTLWSGHYNVNVKAVERSSGNEVVRGCHDGYGRAGILHCREILFNKDELVFLIVDKIVTKKEDISWLIEMPFHIHPSLFPEECGFGCYKIRNNDGRFEVVLTTDPHLTSGIIRGMVSPFVFGWYSQSFMRKVPSYGVLCSVEGKGEKTFITEIKILVK